MAETEATPVESETALVEVRSADAPEPGAEYVTVTPWIGFPKLSKTDRLSGFTNGRFTPADCGVAPVAGAIEATGPGLFVSANEALVPAEIPGALAST